MLGYIRPFKPEMKICEYDIYKAAYCGLCKQLGKQYGPFSRLTLSYDFTFLAILKMALNDSKPELTPKSCFLNPLKKTPCLGDCNELDFSASTAMIMLYYKVMDNYNDGGFRDKVLSTLALPMTKHAYQKAAHQLPEVASIVYETISKQTVLEQERCSSVDNAAEPTALALCNIFMLLTDDDSKKRILSRLGYLMGRFVYLADALDDIEQDLQYKSYNPFVISEQLDASNSTQDMQNMQKKTQEIRENAKGSLYLTISEIRKSYDLLDMGLYAPILDNIITLGLKNSVDSILSGKNNHPQKHHAIDNV